MVKANFENITQNDCRNFCKNCPTCAQYTPAPKDAHITPILSTKPHERLVIDLKDFKNFTDDNDGFHYAMTVVCHFSGYPWVFLLKKKTAAAVKEKLVLLFQQFGPPDILQSDNGREFISHEVVNLLANLNVQFVHGKPRTPREQGKVEKFNGTLSEKVEKMMSERKSRCVIL